MKENIIMDKSFAFAVRVVKLYKYLVEQKKEYIMSKQLMRSGTSIGALTREAQQAESKADFVHKLSISLKEANESDYWIELLHKTEFLTKKEYNAIKGDIEELIKLLISIIKSSKSK